MKYIVLIGDGMADRPLKELGGRTPLQAALTPNMDKLASSGICGMVNTIPNGFEPGSDAERTGEGYSASVFGFDGGHSRRLARSRHSGPALKDPQRA